MGEMLYLILVEVFHQIDQEESEEEDNCQQVEEEDNCQQTVNENNYQQQVEVMCKEEGPVEPPKFRGPLQFQPLLRQGIHQEKTEAFHLVKLDRHQHIKRSRQEV